MKKILYLLLLFPLFGLSQTSRPIQSFPNSIAIDSYSYLLFVQYNGVSYSDGKKVSFATLKDSINHGSGGGLTGAGTINRVPLWSTSSNLINSGFSDSVGVGHSYVNDSFTVRGYFYPKLVPPASSTDSPLVMGLLTHKLRAVAPPKGFSHISVLYPANSYSMIPTGISANTYGDATHIPSITLDQYGIATAATTYTVTPFIPYVFVSPLSVSTNTVSMTQSGASQSGWISNVDWNTFNGKINLTSLHATEPIEYNNITGTFNLNTSVTVNPSLQNVTDVGNVTTDSAIFRNLEVKGFNTGTTIRNAYIQLDSNGVIPTSQLNSIKIFQSTGGNLGWIASKGFVQFINTTTNLTANRTATMPDHNWTADNINTTTTTNGTGFLKGNGSNISFDASTYLTSAVTSVGLTLPNIFSVTPTPITSTGVFSVTSTPQNQNYVWAGPSSGSTSGQPTFRALVPADIPGGSGGSGSVTPTPSTLLLRDGGGNGFDNNTVNTYTTIATANSTTLTLTYSYPKNIALTGTAATTYVLRVPDATAAPQTGEWFDIYTPSGLAAGTGGVAFQTFTGITMTTTILRQGTWYHVVLVSTANNNAASWNTVTIPLPENASTDAWSAVQRNSTGGILGTVVTGTSDGSFNGCNIGLGGNSTASNFRAGANAGGVWTTATNSTAIGGSSQLNVTTAVGNSNTSVGFESLLQLITGNGNTAFGDRSMGIGISSAQAKNTMMGQQSGASLSGAGFNTGIGYQVLANASNSGTENTAIGQAAGGGITSGSFNNFFGSGTDGITTGGKNQIFKTFNGATYGFATITTGSNNLLFGGYNGAGLSTSTSNLWCASDGVGNIKLWCPSSNNIILGGGTTDASNGLLQVSGNIAMEISGNKLNIATGSNASIGISANMVSGTITISTTAVTASSIIFLTGIDAAGVAADGVLDIGTIVAGSSFVINSSVLTDTRKVQWWIVN